MGERLIAAIVVACGLCVATPTHAWAVAPTVLPVAGVDMVAAGDIGNCATTTGAAATAALVGATTGTVATLGDADGGDISLTQYQQCYGPRWGQYPSRTRPAPGNRDQEVSGPTGYYAYFGASAGTAGLGYHPTMSVRGTWWC